MAKKKLSVREQRELQKKQAADAYRTQAQERQAAENARQAEIQKQREQGELQRFVDKVEAKRLIRKSPRVGRVKVYKPTSSAVGVKSALVTKGGVIHMTSAGPVRQNRIEQTSVTPLVDQPVFSASVNQSVGKRYSIHVQNAKYPHLETDISNPLYSSVDVGHDQIGLKAKLENAFFGKTFDGDNVHIQIIYNILDIYKIVAVHANNITYSLNNLFRHEPTDKEERSDFISDLSLENSYEDVLRATSEQKLRTRAHAGLEEFVKLPQLAYFGSVFEPFCAKLPRNASVKQKTDYENARKKHIYYVLAVIGQIRQWCTHSSAGSSLFKLEQVGGLKKSYWEGKTLLDTFYRKRVDELNQGFMELNGKTNFAILFSAYDAKTDEQKKQLVRAFYDYNVRKSYKNLGFSIKRLRECMLALPEVEKFNGQEYDSVRSKLYVMMDFILQNLYITHEDRVQALVEELRTVAGEDPDTQKTAIYCREAIKAWNDVKDTVERAAAGIDKVRQKSKEMALSEKDAETVSKALDGYQIDTNVSYFTKAMYLATQFMDGKEINDLLTNLANKLESIGELLTCMNDMGQAVSFNDKYDMFDDSTKLAAEIRLINSFTRMTKPNEDARQIMFREAAELLGFDAKVDEALLTEMLNKKIDENTPKDKIEEKKGKKIKNMGFRNFIASNVIDSARFRYIIRYGSPAHLRRIANNEAVVRFVLSDMPDNQIDRYHESCKLNAVSTREEKIRDLAKIITGIHFHDFEKVDQKANIEDNSAAARDKAQKQAVISLYLNVLYQLIKNLMYVNARYLIAFRALENDSYMALGLTAKKEDKPKIMACPLTERMIDCRTEVADQLWNSKQEHRPSDWSKRRHMLRPCEYLKADIQNTTPQVRGWFRNQVAHVSAIRNAHLYIDDLRSFDSYFAIYHYLIQRGLCVSHHGFYKSVEGQPDRTGQYVESVETYGTYCRDFTKALCAPFGYNLARFKNLTIDDLFDRNRPPKDKEDTN